ncbi:MAG: transglycosylase SLT domain-containing protein [Desulfovibrio sp.]|nr:transglycosylase SLT domain-containing protein [Desulfovibrio sp.]
MTRSKAFAVVTAGLGGGLFLLGLLAGFVPQSDGPEVRRKANAQVVRLRPEDVPAPIQVSSDGIRFWAVRRTVDTSHASQQCISQSASADGTQVVTFGPEGVRLNVGLYGFDYGSAPDGREPLTPLLALDGASMPGLLTAQPQHYGDALDAQGRPVRWLAEDALLTGYMPRPVRTFTMAGAFPTPAGDVLDRANHYRDLVESFSRRFNLSTNLIFAIIHSESSFRPNLVSSSSAMGLMQLLPSTAGGEVHRFLYGQSGDVGFEDLSVPEINIRYGTAYLHILMTRYFQNVRDPLAREYCVVAAYNMGPNRFLRMFGENGSAAVERINSMSAEELYEELTAHLPVRETRFYVAKVRRMKDHFAAELR